MPLWLDRCGTVAADAVEQLACIDAHLGADERAERDAQIDAIRQIDPELAVQLADAIRRIDETLAAARPAFLAAARGATPDPGHTPRLGTARGKLVVRADFNEPLPPEVLHEIG